MSAQPATFGKYFLAEKIATGGMAEIHLAKLLGPGGFEKQLIIKQIHPDLAARTQFVEMFVEEAKTLVMLSHGNIVPIYELGVVDGTYFIAMEYIDGPNLAQLVRGLRQRDERIAPPVAAYIAIELLKGLDYAHRKGDGVIHRDLSPRNVMFSREGEVKIVDFGIAATGAAGSAGASNRPQTSRPEGSFPYMSPEQVRGEKLTPQSDLFSAGILLWEMLTGEPLFLRDTADETLRAVLAAPVPDPSQHQAQLPAALDVICSRALARDRAERYRSAAEPMRDLTRYLYSADLQVTATTLSQLVARACPPVTAVGPTGTADERRRPRRATAPGADATRPMPGRGRRDRSGPTASFATNVAFEDVLRNATPLMPIEAIAPDIDRDAPGDRDDRDDRDPDDDATGPMQRVPRPMTDTTSVLQAAESVIGEIAHEGPEPGSNPVIHDEEIDFPADQTIRVPRKAVRQRRTAVWLAVLALAAVTAAGGGFVVFYPPDGDRPIGAPGDAGAAALAPPDARAMPKDASQLLADAGSDADRRPRPRRRSDADPDEGAEATEGDATLEVGASPWGVVYVDGAQVGQAPGRWTVSPGRHTVTVELPIPGSEQKRTFDVELAPGAVLKLPFVEFTPPE